MGALAYITAKSGGRTVQARPDLGPHMILSGTRVSPVPSTPLSFFGSILRQALSKHG